MKIPQEISNLSNFDLLLQSPSLSIKSNDKTYTLDNIQTLYLYPLSLFDYIDNLYNNEIIKLTFISLDREIDYKELFNNNFKFLKTVEFIIDDTYIDKLDLLKELIDIFYEKNIKITLTINNLIEFKDSLKDYYKKITYFKIYMNNIINKTDEDFYKYLKIISNNKSAFIHIKTYLNLDEYKYYEDTINKLKLYNVGIFQVSKELIPLGIDNIKIDCDIEKYIRFLEEKYPTFNTKFMSVKDLSTLYYPRFELDERNKKKCYACLMKPYIDGKYMIPCKVNKIINNEDKYGVLTSNIEKYKNRVQNIGESCSECASIFENDALGNISEFINDDTLEVELL